ncbi:MAG: SsrA-binding protein SmpB [Saprospiraceae bacterium]|nr:SsrA-binding protein SmpB [Saprospiraceae bacterium]HMW39520.1 SsrA-binding protein SmpB [Saprospiraceae bacterium]HMX89458.1 SsrA-binding protein SmpB [Saprospiraceae bacterium]HMZ41306.1 SsrA-binding protein SmpB [Saprospiraceae bacterium]HNA65076.1 SsrA-binding protein SmpB [Saprospiraceae bacterium]
MSDSEIVNRKATHLYFFEQTFEAGIQLTGTEVKSIKAGKANLSDAYCSFERGELWLRNMHISEYDQGSNNHDPRRPRKLLLNKTELRKMERKVNEKGVTIIPYRIYLSDRGMFKIEVAVATGKKSFDKRESIKERDQKRELDRSVKNYK